MSDAGLRDWLVRRSKKLQVAGFLVLHRSSRELLAASFFSTGRTKQADINLLELEAVHIAIGLLQKRRGSVQVASPALNFGPSFRRWPAVKAKHFREGGGSFPSSWRRKPQHTSETLLPQPRRVRAEVHAVIDESNWRYNQAFEEALAWTKLVNVAGTAPLCGLREFIQPHTGISCLSGAATLLTREGQKAVEGEEMLQLVQHLLACLKMCRSSGTLSINLPVSQTSRASLPCLIDLPSKSLQVPVAHWRTRLGANEKRRFFSHCFENEARNKWLLRSYVSRIWLMRLSLITDVSPTHQVHWPRRPPREPCGNDYLPNFTISLIRSRQSWLRKFQWS